MGVTISASLGMDFRNFDFYALNANSYFADIYQDVFVTVGGVTYEDLFEVDWQYAGVTYGSIFGGNGLTVTPGGIFTGGTVTGYFQSIWNGSAWVSHYSIEGMSISAVAFQQPFLTPSIADDYSMIEQIMAGNDTVTGSGFDDVLFGYGGNDVLRGGLGADVLNGGPGNDAMEGGAGFDTAIFAGLRSSYQLLWDSGAVHVLGPDGSDTLTNVEQLGFADTSVLVSSLPATLSIAATSADKAEGQSGTTPFTFTVTRSGDTSVAHSANWAVSGAAVAAADFVGGVLPSGTVNFAAGETSKVVTVNVAGDTAVEADEGFTVTLSTPSTGATLGTATATGTIQNDDAAPVAGSVSISDVSVTEGNSGTKLAVFTVTRAGGTAALGVNYATADNTAMTSDGDYLATSGTLQFGAGVNSQTISVVINGDSKFESLETFQVNLSSPSNGATLGDASGLGTIQNDDFNSIFGSPGNDTLIGGAGDDTIVGDPGAIDFDGSGDRIVVADSASLDISGNITIEAWVRLDGLQPTFSTLIAKGDWGYQIRMSASHPGAIEFITGTPGGPVRGVATISTTLLDTGAWYHVAGVVNGGQQLIYINGQLESTTARGTSAVDTNDFDLWIGANAEMPGRDFNGALTDVRVWSVARSASEIADAMSSRLAGNEIGLQANWLLDSGLGSFGEDHGPNGNTGQVIGNPTSTLAFGNDTLDGGAGNDTLNGGAGNDVLRGGLGNDVLDGGDGTDTADYSVASGKVTVNLATTGWQSVGGGMGSDTLTDIENVRGSSLGDALTGTGAANRIDGGGGADFIYGLGGDDVLFGGTGGDTVDGGAGNDTVVGGAGNDTLIGGTGIDILDYSGFGGAVIVNMSNKAAQNTNAAGTDMLSEFEDILGGSFNDKFVGTTVANLMLGGAGSDQLSGLGGADRLEGNNGNDTLAGGAGDDRLTGGAGRDVLVGGANNDTFSFLDVSDSLVGAQRDRINDFVQGSDLVDLSAIDAISGGSDNGFTFVGGTAFTATAGELRFFQLAGPGQSIVEGDVDGNGAADFQIAFMGLFTFNSGDFVL